MTRKNMTTHQYIHTNKTENGKTSVNELDLVTAIRAINYDYRVHNQLKLKSADATEWATITELLQSRMEWESGLSASLGRTNIYISQAEVMAAYDIAQHMLEIQQKAEASYLDEAKAALPNTASTLGEKIRQEFPADVAAQAIVLNQIENHAASLQSCTADAQASLQ